MVKENETKEILINEFQGKPTIEAVKDILISNIKFNWIERKVSYFRNKKIQIYLNQNLEKEYFRLLYEYSEANKNKQKNKLTTIKFDYKIIKNYDIKIGKEEVVAINEIITENKEELSSDNISKNELDVISSIGKEIPGKDKNKSEKPKKSKSISNNRDNLQSKIKDKRIKEKVKVITQNLDEEQLNNINKSKLDSSLTDKDKTIKNKSNLEVLMEERKIYNSIDYIESFDYNYSEGIYKDYLCYIDYSNDIDSHEEKYTINNIFKYVNESYIPSYDDYEYDEYCFDDLIYPLLKLNDYQFNDTIEKICLGDFSWLYDEDEIDYVSIDSAVNIARERLYIEVTDKISKLINDNKILKDKLKYSNIKKVLNDNFNEIFEFIQENDLPHIKKEMIYNTENEIVDFICVENFNWMFDYLKKNVVEREYKNLVLNNEEEKIEIINICRARKINSLVHFTNIKNLTSIIMNGIIPVMFQDEYKINPEINDINRIDDHLECTSFSIEFPNYRFFYNLRDKNKDKRFVIIKVNPAVIWNKYRNFCIHNAADSRILAKNKYSLSKSSEFSKMFSNIGIINRETLNIPDNYTTDPQAEVLIEGHIEVKYIDEIIFKSYEDYNNFINNNQLKSNIKFKVNSRYFSARSDYNYWH